MKWTYQNNTNGVICYKSFSWLPNSQFSIPFPVPETLGLTCIQEGSLPDPILFHDDITVAAGTSACIQIPAPALSHNVFLNIQCMIQNSGVECRFNHHNNKPVPIDIRGFSQTLPWECCYKIFLDNPTDIDAIISVTAIESGV